MSSVPGTEAVITFEATPNPRSRKVVLDRPLRLGDPIAYQRATGAFEGGPMIAQLLDIPHITIGAVHDSGSIRGEQLRLLDHDQVPEPVFMPVLERGGKLLETCARKTGCHRLPADLLISGSSFNRQ